ncbi:MAG: RNA methyltransferase [Methyloceanibacter sp.]|uniref:RNA methyltransferase n=1 Tax=Methyloceanibacter sp. TaxID=1965321 RepID=UPI003D6CC374
MMKVNAGRGKRAGDNDAGEVKRARQAPERPLVTPAVVLVHPQLGENIGFAARAMANFGLSDLRLVAPRDGWPNDKAIAAAAGAVAVVDRATVYDTIEAAIGDLNYVLATTARPREMVKLVLSPETAAAALRERASAAERTGVMFGAERSGLDNDAIALADAILTAPVSPGFASLSLPQAVLLFSYEWLKCQSPKALGRITTFDGPALEGTPTPDTWPATRAELFGLFEHLEGELDRSGFLRPPEKRPSMVRSIRNMFHRMGVTEQDVRTWRGIITALTRRPPSRG